MVISERGFSERLSGLTDRRRIAVVQVRGAIGGAARTDELIRTIGQARRNARVRAVLLEIDSPGGTAIASEQLYVAVRRLAARKPVVAWIKGVGASGAYFLACAATRVLAFPSALVGSIGVISVRPILVDALRRAGARVSVTKTGQFKDLGAPWREPTEEDEARERELVDAIFQRFTGAVRSARGYDDASLARVTTGEVWLGTRAVELGLIDGLADDEDSALEAAQDLAALPHHLTLRLGGRRTLLQRLGVPGAGMGPPGERWLVEMETWLGTPRLQSLNCGARRGEPRRGSACQRPRSRKQIVALARALPNSPRRDSPLRTAVQLSARRGAPAVEAEEHGHDDDQQENQSSDDGGDRDAATRRRGVPPPLPGLTAAKSPI